MITDPHPCLRTKAAPVETITADIKRLARDMMETMRAAQGIGLAAPQVSHSIRMIVVWDPESKKTTAMINPMVVKKSFRKYVDQEGCLSIPGVYGNVKRNRWIVAEYLDTHGNKQTLKAEMLHSRIIQHEIDHLDGILFTDKVVGKLVKTEVL